MMRRIFLALFACLLVFTLTFSDLALAQPLAQLSFPGLNNIQLTPEQKAAVEELETEIIPQIEGLLRPEQLEEFKLQIEDGKSFRKAFKALTLTPEQKNSLAELIKSLPKSDAFASLTPEQKRAYFLNHKTLFVPTPEEIAERIKTGMKAKGGTMPSIDEITEKIKANMSAKEGAPSAEEIAEKINLGMQKKEMYMPKLQAIGEQITAKLKAFTQSGE
jgi:hypothetical protein